MSLLLPIAWIDNVDINGKKKTNNFWKAVYIVKDIRQLFSEHRVSMIDSSAHWMTEETEIC